MMTLVRICGQHRRAVERDLLVLGYRWEDVGTSRLATWELVSIVLASPPGTAVYHAETRSGAMTPEQQMLAKALGFQAGDASVPAEVAPPPSPQKQQPPDPLSRLASATIGGQAVLLDALPPEEFRAKRDEIAARIAASQGRSRDKVHREQYDPFEAAKRLRDERRRANAQV